MSVSFQNFTGPYQELQQELDEAYHRFMKSGWYVLGKELEAFEEEYAAYCESKHCVGVGHGLDALHLALRALEVGKGDEVIVPSNTYIATWLAVTQAGATIVPVEPDPVTHNIDPTGISKAVTAKTKAILPVNLYGHPVDYDQINAIAENHGISVVIDNAQAHGAKYKGKVVGGLATIECHSFYPSKNLGAFGEGGAITTNTPGLADKVRVLRNYGSRIRYQNEVPGYNSRLDELQAAFLRVKLRKLNEWTDRRKAAARRYLEGLAGIESLTLPKVEEWGEHVWHLFVIRHPERDDLKNHLDARGIQTLVHYPIPPHSSQAYKHLNIAEDALPVATKLSQEVMSLPISPFIAKSEIDEVIATIASYRD